jgi:hypothetical protein
MRLNRKLRAGLLIGALALTLVAVRWADTLTDVTEASAGAVVEAVPRARPATRTGAGTGPQATGPAAPQATSPSAPQATSPAAPQATWSSTPQATGQPAPALDLQKLQRPPALDPDGDPFGPRSFRPAPPKLKAPPVQAMLEAPPLPSPPPQAPPLPFIFMGRLSEARDTTVFLTMGDRNLIVKPGDTIDNTYKVEEVSDTAVVLTYLPMNLRQTLPIGTP